MRAVIGDVKKMSELSDNNLIEDLEKNIRRAKDKRGVDGVQPEWEVHLPDISAGGLPIVKGWEASAYVQPGQYKTVIHASVCPGGDCNEGAGQSSRTLKGLACILHE